jgi:RimJ/RimL family protein N-acetyltransferase
MKPFVAKTNLYTHSLDTRAIVEPLVTCEVKKLDKAQVYVLHEVWPVNLEQMTMRLHRGDCCFICQVNGRVAHYSWVQFSGLHEIRDVSHQFEIRQCHAWIYHCRTAEWARGMQIYPFVLTRILNLCKARDCRQAWIYTTPKNIASQRGIQKAGFAFQKQLIAINLLGLPIPVSRL